MSSVHEDASSGRPDLDEFLLTLGGFLEQKSSSRHPNNIRFLSMFCRSIGAADGQLLRPGKSGLSSVASVGLGEGFDDEFNALHAQSPSAPPSPLNESFLRRRVIAVVDLKKENAVPHWFLGLMEKHQMRSVVAVPLLGRDKPVGVLVAYYRDVCLFDQNTLDHLMMVGKMIGSAMERQGTEGAEPLRAPLWDAFDKFLGDLTARPVDRTHLFQLLAEAGAAGVPEGGVVAGPIRAEPDHYLIHVCGAVGIPPKAMNLEFRMPRFLEKIMAQNALSIAMGSAPSAEWGSFKQLVGDNDLKYLLFPLVCMNKQVGAIIGWFPHDRDCGEDVKSLFERLAKIGSVALMSL